MKCLITLAIVFSGLFTQALLAAETPQDAELVSLVNAFMDDYKSLKIPELTPDYKENFKSIQDLEGIDRQIKVFDLYQRKSKEINAKKLSLEARYLYRQLQYEIRLNQQRLALEHEFKEKYAAMPVPEDGLFKLPQHKRWYRFYIKWVASKNITPEEVLRLGEKEMRRVTVEIGKIQKTLGYENNSEGFYRHLNGDSFFMKDQKAVSAAYEEIRTKAYRELGSIVEDTDVPVVKINPIPNPTKDAPPGYYDEGVFYYNFFVGKYNKRAMDWIFIHESVPGHHYQITVKQAPALVPAFRKQFWYQGFTEGWAAYTEDIGKEIGFYGDPYRYLGKWEWDLVRSTRLVIDVGIHFKGWSKEKALEFWRKHVPNQEEIAIREIDRITRWPGQVISYKIGEAEILRLKQASQKRLGKRFDQRKFHSLILGRGSIPLELLERIVRKSVNSH